MINNASHFSELVEKLETILHLSRYEAKVILALILDSNPQIVREISQAAHVPIQRTYDILEKLEEKGMIIQTAKSPKTYAAKSFESILTKRLLEERILLNEWYHKEVERIKEEKRTWLGYLRRQSEGLVEMTTTLRTRSMAEPTKIVLQIEGWDNI